MTQLKGPKQQETLLQRVPDATSTTSPMISHSRVHKHINGSAHIDILWRCTSFGEPWNGIQHMQSLHG
jgi:hypothetical protein